MLDSVAPHRIDTARFADATLLHVRSSQRSLFVRSVKYAIDRVGGAVLLLLASPVLFAMMAMGPAGLPWTGDLQADPCRPQRQDVHDVQDAHHARRRRAGPHGAGGLLLEQGSTA
ncbi:MAG: hypothetical protein U0R78_00640 [Nocardioidaceae bacterium]